MTNTNNDSVFGEKLSSKDNNYIRPEITQQDLISQNPEVVKEKLKGFIMIFPQHYGEISCGSWIKYITNEGKYRSGGILKQNKAPDYFILKSPYNNKSWSVSLEKNEIYLKTTQNGFDKQIEKNNLYKLYEAGLVQITDNVSPEEIKAVLES